MAIDKALEDQIKVPKQVLDEEVELEAGPPLGTDDIDIQMTDDGGAEIDFDPEAMAMQGAQEHDANLAEFLEPGVTSRIASDLQGEYQEYKGSRSEWEDTYTKGLIPFCASVAACIIPSPINLPPLNIPTLPPSA